MLLSLHIRDFAIIDELEIDLAEGMTALTGETGAGKSILLDALGLLLGDRADADSVRHGAERAEVSADFAIADLPAVQDWLQAQSLDRDGSCQIRRVVSREGRSRAYINGTPAPVQSLKQLGEQLVDIHGQHEHQSLMRPAAQRQLLDAHGRHTALLEALAQTYRSWQETLGRIEAIVGADRERDSRLEFMRFQLAELEELALGDDELAALHDEQRRLANAGELIETCERCLQHLYDDDEQAAYTHISRALRDMAAVADTDPSVNEIPECLDNALVQLREAVDTLRHYRDGLEPDPERLQQVEQRLELIHRLARKHRIEAEQLPAFSARLQQELAQLEQAGQTLDQLEAQRETLQADYLRLAGKLHRARQQTARTLGEAVSERMQALGMAGGRFVIDVSTRDDARHAEHGTDRVEFRVSANPGQPLRPLTRVASGGELSRISLAIQVIAAQATPIPTRVFDEVDSGIGGGTAETVGSLLRRLGAGRQVLCVTHLPQVASQAHHHLQVSKSTGAESTRTRLRRLEDKERVEEIARMLGGRKITASTRQHAEEMLKLAGEQ